MLHFFPLVATDGYRKTINLNMMEIMALEGWSYAHEQKRGVQFEIFPRILRF